MTSRSNPNEASLFGGTMADELLAPTWLALEIEKRARILRVCLPELCELHSDGEAMTPAAMTRADALQLKITLGLKMAMKLADEKKGGKDAG